jgi:serine/threonine protein kinase
LVSERTIFMAALEQSTPEHRAAFLDEACAGDAALRERVEALLRSHEQGGSFLGEPVPERVAAALAGAEGGAVTQGEPPDADAGGEAFPFLTPTDRPGVLGRLGHYDILEVIGRGGMGVVLRAFDEKLHRVVAVKVMASQLATNGTARKRFTREAQAAAAVSHDHIVTIHAVEEAAGHPYLVMHYVSGMSLQERLDRNGPLQLAEIVRIGVQTAAGLAAAHAQGLVHRDIKPANILLENGIERVKITDFGLARAASDASLTQSGVVAGTPQYMSPEQARGEAVDQRTDLFSLGSVLYAMCTGRAPFRASESMAVLKRVCEERPRPIRETNTDIPDWLVAIVDKLHAKDPADRYQSAAEVAALLNQHLAHLQHPSVAPLPVTRSSKPPAAQPRRVVAGVAMLFLAAIAIGVSAALLGVFDPETIPVEKDQPTGKGPTETAAKPDPHPFVVLGSKGVAVRTFDTLAEAVQGSSGGDTIEIRGNGPFVCGPVKLTHALTIRAADGYRPVLQFAENLQTDAALVLEGLELQRVGQKVPHGDGDALVLAWGSPSLHIVNCGLREHLMVPCVQSNAPICVLRNCEFLSPLHRAARLAGKQCVIDNSLAAGWGMLELDFEVQPSQPDISVQISRSSLRISEHALLVQLYPVQPDKFAEKDAKRVRFDASSTIFDTPSVVVMNEVVPFLARLKPQPEEAKALLLRMLTWRDRGNLYIPGGSLLLWNEPPKGVAREIGPRSLADWKKVWASGDADAVEGRVKYQGGDLLAKLRDAPEKLTPEDFRLRADSPGYKAGKDLGADVDLVGPGAAYGRWKKTPEYQQWLKTTGQRK